MAKLLSKVSLAVLALVFLFGAPTGIASAPTAQAQIPAPFATSTPVVKEDAIACNCYAYVRSLIPSLPMANKIIPNTTPHIGAVAVFDYHGLPHYGIIVSITGDGFMLKDSNYSHCKYLTHFVSWNDKAIVGFWGT